LLDVDDIAVCPRTNLAFKLQYRVAAFAFKLETVTLIVSSIINCLSCS